ncbi:MAG: type II secretion system protein [bacterium]
MKKQNQQGITLVQILVFAGIIGIVVLGFMILLGNERAKSRDNIRLSNIKQIQAAIEMFYSQNGSYPSTDFAPAKENSGHNWLPNMDDHGIQNDFKMFLPQSITSPIPADSAVCRGQKICNNDQSSISNDFCYTAFPEGCSAAGDVKCADFLLDFCLSGAVGELNAGRHSANRDGVK